MDSNSRRRRKRAGGSCVSACSLPSCVPQQDGLFMGGLHGSLTEKTLIQHILSMFTYRDRGVGGNLRVCFCVLERELIWYHPVGLLCVCVCVRKWLLSVFQVIGWEVTRRAVSFCQKCKQAESAGLCRHRWKCSGVMDGCDVRDKFKWWKPKWNMTKGRLAVSLSRAGLFLLNTIVHRLSIISCISLL